MRLNIEEFSQARRIHGGLVQLWAASLGVRLARVPIPTRRLREHVFSRIYGDKYPALSESDLEKPLHEFRSINELFTRGVRADRRPMPHDTNQLICPCDCTVQDAGTIDQTLVVTAKGIPYSLASLLATEKLHSFSGGQYAVLFLSPSDCHRVFCPTASELVEITHIPGRRLLVHPPFQKKEYPVFTLNERVVMHMRTSRGSFALVMIAGWGVGNITHPFHYGPRKYSHRLSRHVCKSPERFNRGDRLATFELGSTVILVTEQPLCDPLRLVPGQTLRYGEPLAAIQSPVAQSSPSARTSIALLTRDSGSNGESS
jgi:phosphatidylserine decarboxylase